MRTGKTTLTEGIADILGPDRVTQVCTDDYHNYGRKERAQFGADGSLARPEYVKPGRFVIVEGLLGFHAARMRECFDVKVYLDPPEDLRRVWKIRRDTTKRGYMADQVLAELERREKDSARFIRPQRAYADIVVRCFPDGDMPPENANGRLNVRLVLRPTIPHPDLSDVLDRPGVSRPCGIRLQLGRDDGLPVDFLEVGGHLSPEETMELETAIWKRMPETTHLRPDLIGTYADRDDRRHSDPLALTQLLITYHLLDRLAVPTGRLWGWTASGLRCRPGSSASAWASPPTLWPPPQCEPSGGTRDPRGSGSVDEPNPAPR